MKSSVCCGIIFLVDLRALSNSSKMEGMGFSREKCDPPRQFGRGGEGLGGEDSVSTVFANLMPQSYQLHAHCKSSFGTDAAMWLRSGTRVSTGRWDRIGKARKKIEASSYLNPLKDLLKYFGDGSSGVLHPPNNTMAATKPARMITFFIMLRRLNPQLREVSTSLSVRCTVQL